MYQQDIPPAPHSGEQQVLHDARAVHDLATFPVLDYRLPDGSPDWILARIAPSPQSGAATIPGAYLRDGKLVSPANTPTVIMKIGAWTRLASGGPNTHDGGVYSWTEPMGEEKRQLSPEDRYSPFTLGGSVLFRYTPTPPGNPFSAARLIFPDWAGDAPKGARLLLQFSSALERGAEKDLVRLFDLENPLLAAAAFRRLLQTTGVDRTTIPSRYVGSRGHLLAVYTYLLITETPDSDSTRELLRAAYEGASPEMLRSIAAGAYSASVFNGRFRPAADLAASTLAALRERLGDVAIDTDPYLHFIFPR